MLTCLTHHSLPTPAMQITYIELELSYNLYPSATAHLPRERSIVEFRKKSSAHLFRPYFWRVQSLHMYVMILKRD